MYATDVCTLRLQQSCQSAIAYCFLPLLCSIVMNMIERFASGQRSAFSRMLVLNRRMDEPVAINNRMLLPGFWFI